MMHDTKGDVDMEKCPNCKSALNIDEKASGKCFSCGASFETELTTTRDYRRSINYGRNSIAKTLKLCGIIDIICGTIGSIYLALKSPTYVFVVSEASTVISGLLFLGLSEIIQLLEDIKNKIK